MMNASAAAERSPGRPLLVWSVVSALAIGSLASLNPFAAVAVLLGIAVIIGSYYRPQLIVVILTASVFLEVITFGGLTVSRLVAPLALLVVVFGLSTGAAHLKAAPPLLWVSLYCLWATASMLWTTDASGTKTLLASLGIALVYMIAFAALIESTETLIRVVVVFIVAAVGVGLFAIASFIGLVGAGTLQQGRTSGAVGDANFFAAYQLIVLPLTLALANSVQRRAAALALYGAAAILIGSIVTTVSRGGIIALLVVVVATFIVPSKNLFRSGAQKVGALAVVVATASLLFYSLSGTFAPRIQEMFNGSGGGSGRTVLWSGARTSIGERPLLGLGFGAFASNSNELILRTPGVVLTSYALRPHGEEVHSAYIGTTAELGFPGLLLFLAILVSTARYLRRVAREAREAGAETIARISSALVLSLLGWAIASLFLSSETSRPVWIVIGLALALGKLLETHRVEAAAG